MSKTIATAAALMLALVGCSQSDDTPYANTSESSAEATATDDTTTDDTEATDDTTTDDATNADANTPVTTEAEGDMIRHTLANGRISIAVPAAWGEPEESTEEAPVSIFNEDTTAFAAVTEIGPAALVPDEEAYIEALENNLGLEKGEVEDKGEVQLNGGSAHRYDMTVSGLGAQIYAVQVDGVAYEITLMGTDAEAGSLKAILDSVLIK